MDDELNRYWLRVPGKPAMRATIEADNDDAAYMAALDVLCEHRWWAERGARLVLLTRNNVRIAEIELDPVD